MSRGASRPVLAVPMLVIALTLPLSACAITNKSDVPALAAAPASSAPGHPLAGTLQGSLEESFPDTFAGLIGDEQQQNLVVYRLPDPDLDAFVRDALGQTPVEFRDAAYSLRQMNEVVKQLGEDTAHWKDQGVELNACGPQPDGSGVQVFVTKNSPETERAFQQRYPNMHLTIAEMSPAVPLAGS